MDDITGEEFGERTKEALRSHTDGWVVIADALTYIGELEEANAHLRAANDHLKEYSDTTDLLAEISRLRERLSAAEQRLKHYQDKADPYEPANMQQLKDMAAHVNEVHESNRILRIELSAAEQDARRLREAMTKVKTAWDELTGDAPMSFDLGILLHNQVNAAIDAALPETKQ